MRIDYVCLDPGVPALGKKGSSLHCQEIIRCFLNRRADVRLLATRLGAGGPLFKSADRALSIEKLSKHLSKQPERREQELLDLNFTLRQRLEQRSTPPDLVYERFSLWSCAAMEYADENQIPGILEVNSPLIEEQARYRTLVNPHQALAVQRKCFAGASCIVAVSEAVRQYLEQFPEAGEKTIVIPNGVHWERFQQPPSTDSRSPDSGKTVIGFVGSLKPWHGVDRLIAAFAEAINQIPHLELQIVGDGPQRQTLEDQIQCLNPIAQRAIRLLGHVGYEQMPDVLHGFDIAVAPYPRLETFYFSPLKILEYMAAGCAIVASNIGQISDLICHRKNGLLANPDSTPDLVSQLLELANSADLRRRLGNAGRQAAFARHRWEQVTDRILKSVPLSGVDKVTA